jgi:assimilatory nitrate reductase catalytic subunit
MTRTGTLGRLFGHVAEPALQLNAADMAARSLAEGDLVHVTSRHGSLIVPAHSSGELAPGQAFMAMHWGGEYLGGRSSTGAPLAGVNTLTTPAFCPSSKQPELKHTAVKVLKAELPWSLLALAWLPDTQALAVRDALRALMPAFAFATCVPFGRERSGVLLRAAAYEAPPDDLLARIEQLLGLSGTEVLRYADRKQGQRRAMRLARVAGDTRLEAFVLAGDTRAEAWIQDRAAGRAAGAGLRAPAAGPGRPGAGDGGRARPPGLHLLQRGRRRHPVHAGPLRRQRRPAPRCRAGQLKCGTNCGSCPGAAPPGSGRRTRPPDRRAEHLPYNPKSSELRHNCRHGNQPLHQGDRPRQGRRPRH